MSSGYAHQPDSWDPVLAGTAAGAVGAIAGALIVLPVTSPDTTFANSLSISILGIAIGALSGLLWRRLRATRNGTAVFRWTIGGAWLIALTAIAIADQVWLSTLFPYAAPVAVVMFLSIGLLTPPFDRLAIPSWVAVIPVVASLAIGVGLL